MALFESYSFKACAEGRYGRVRRCAMRPETNISAKAPFVVHRSNNYAHPVPEVRANMLLCQRWPFKGAFDDQQ